MQGPWDDYGSAPSGQSAPGGLTRITPPAAPKAPDPYQVQKDERSDARSDTNTGLSIQSGDRSQKGQVQDFRKEFRTSPPVKTYDVSIQSLSNAINRGADATGDASLIYDWAKAMDPESVVRESEVGLAQTGQSMIETAAARIKKELGYQEGGLLDPKNRERLIREIITAAKSRRKAYEQQRDYYTGISQRNQFNPEDVIGPHLGEPFREELSHFGVSGRKFSDEEMAARANGGSPPTGGFLPGATPDNITFDMDTGTGAFGNDVAGKRLTSEQEKEYAAFIESNRATLTPELLEAWWKSRGFGGVEDAAEVVKAAKEGRLGGIDYSKTDQERRAEMEALAQERYGDDPSTRASLLLKGGSLNLSDELAGVGGAIYDTLSGGSPAEGYQRERDLERFVQEESRDKYGVGWEIGGALATPMGWMKAPKNTAEFAKQGGMLGAVAGFGEGEGAGGSLANSAAGTVLGAATGAGIGKAGSALAGRKAVRAERQAARSNLAQDFEQAGVRAMPANVGGAGVNRITSGMAQSPIGAETIRTAAKGQADDFAGALKETSENTGRVLAESDAGESFRKAATAGIERDGKRIGKIYEAANRVAGDATIVPNQGIRQIDNEIARLSETKDIEGPLITELERLKGSLTQNPSMSVEALKRARGFAGKASSTDALRNTDAKATMKRIFGALADDFDVGLRSAGRPKAADLFRKADDLWSARIDDIDKAWEPVIGKKRSGEQIVESIESMASGKGGGFARLKTVMSGASVDERSDMVATVIDRMGRASPGRQGAANDTYSADTFLTNWSKMSDKAKDLLFPGAKTRESLNRLARVAESVKESGRFANASNTSGGMFAQMLAGGLGYAVGDVTGLAAPAASTYLTARLMTSPRFVQWLSRAPKNMTPQAAKTYAGKLRGISAAEPAIAGDVSRFAQFMNAANDASPSRAVAQGQDENN